MDQFIASVHQSLSTLPDNPTALMYAGSGLIFVILLIWLIRLERKIHRVLIGKNAVNLEDALSSVSKDLKTLRQFTKDMEEYLSNVETRLKKSVQSVETIRYNPFKGTGSGSNQSFSTSFLNEHGDGLVLTSMYARDRISMFAKPVKTFASEFELSEEERDSIAKGKERLSHQ